MYTLFQKLQLTQRLYANQLNEVLLPFGLSSGQWGVIRYLFEVGPATASDMAAYWQVEKPTITPLAQKLVARDFIYISTGLDKRQKMMRLTGKGMEVYHRLKENVDLLQGELAEGMTADEKEKAEYFLDKLLVNLRERG